MTEIEQQLLNALEQLNNDVIRRFEQLNNDVIRRFEALTKRLNDLEAGSDADYSNPLSDELSALETRLSRLLKGLDDRLSAIENGR